MKLPKLTKEVAEKIDRDHQRFLQREGLSEDFDDPDLANDEAQLANHKREALAEYLGCDVEDIEWDGDNQFSYGNKEYIICDEEEAYELAKESVRNIIDDLGLESFSEEFRDQILNDDRYFDYDTVRGWMQESYEGYAEDIAYETDPDFGDRLTQEMYERGVLTDDDFVVESDGSIDYYDLKPEVDLEGKKQEFIEKLCEDMDPVQWLQDIYGTGRDFAKVVSDNDLLDWDKVAEECVDTDGIAHSLASYDGKEIALEGDLRAYRTN